jgi:hypothetical protein
VQHVLVLDALRAFGMAPCDRVASPDRRLHTRSDLPRIRGQPKPFLRAQLERTASCRVIAHGDDERSPASLRSLRHCAQERRVLGRDKDGSKAWRVQDRVGQRVRLHDLDLPRLELIDCGLHRGVGEIGEQD